MEQCHEDLTYNQFDSEASAHAAVKMWLKILSLKRDDEHTCLYYDMTEWSVESIYSEYNKQDQIELES